MNRLNFLAEKLKSRLPVRMPQKLERVTNTRQPRGVESSVWNQSILGHRGCYNH